MTRKRFHGLKRVKVRMTWNKYNLYNISRLRTRPNFGTFFQQKWAAKSASRAYHGEQIREKQWQRMFTSKLDAVIPMDHRYLAENDGSEFAAGRGSGLQEKPLKKDHPDYKKKQHIPYMAMTYAPIERRLDVAVFRALFASSVRQARQFVIHGSVKVNGQKMPYPGYLLNPGDMYQVEPERVLFATGKPKSPEQVKEGRKQRKTRKALNVAKHEKRIALKADALKQAKANIAQQKREAKVAANLTPPTSQEMAENPSELELRKQRRKDLQLLRVQIQDEIDSPKTPPGAKRKKVLRELAKEVKLTMGAINKKSNKEIETETLTLLRRTLLAVGQYTPDLTKVGVSREALTQPAESTVPSSTDSSSNSKKKEFVPWTAEERDQHRLKKLNKVRNKLTERADKVIDESKPYATPWSPRPFMSAFAFIPRFLEVNHKICSAVYLRHPVARPGLSEVPTPFHPDTMQLAHNWYLRRR